MMRHGMMLVLVVGCAACGGGDDDKNDGKASIGTAGGTLKSADGRVALTIPAGALSSTVEIQIAKTTDLVGAIAGSSYAISAPAVSLTAPATIAFDQDAFGPVTTAQAIPTVWMQCTAAQLVCAYVYKGIVECPPDHPIYVGMRHNVVNDGELFLCSLDEAPPPKVIIQGLPGLTSETLASGSGVTLDIPQLGDFVAGLFADEEPPTLNLTTSKSTVAPTDSFALIATVSDDNHVDHAQFFSMSTVVTGSGDDAVVELVFEELGTIGEEPFVWPVALTNAAAGQRQYAAVAFDTAGNPSDTDVTSVVVDPNLVNSGPTVILSASSTTVNAAGDVMLTAAVTATAAIAKVEFFEGGTKLGEDTTSPYTQALSYTDADNGTHTYFARATDADSLTGNSNNVGVEVSIGVVETFDYYVDPVGGDDDNDGTTQGTAVRTLCKVRTLVAAGDRIGLMDGVYDSSAAGVCSLVFQNEVDIKAVNAGAAILEVRIAMNGGGEVAGLLIRKGNGLGGFDFGGGNVTVSGLTFGDISTHPASRGFPLVFGTGTTAVYNPGTSDVLTVDVPNSAGFGLIYVHGASTLTVNGGTFNDTGAGNADSYCNALFEVSVANLILNGVTVNHKGASVAQGGGSVSIRQNSVLRNRSVAPNAGCYAVATVSLAASFAIEDASLSGGVKGVDVIQSGGDSPTVTMNSVTLDGFTDYGIDSNSLGTVTMSFEDVTIINAGTGLRTRGNHQLTMRGSHINSNTIGVEITGNQATSDIDLGRSDQAGGNDFTGNTTTGVKVAWTTPSAGAEPVLASGNTWNVGQGSASGQYTVGTSDAGPESGTNYSLTAATDTIAF